ncbi:autotransporter outer membrane beta-barrel domain-containing protein, partial [Mesorhizobium sp. M00.F.Ca.ET.158.01.1.1]
IDSTSSVLAGNSFGYGVVPFDSSQLVTVNNAGAIDLTNDSPAPGTGTSLHDTFTIHGNYVGQDGRLLLNTFLGTDNSPSDRLVIENGAASASTSILVTNVDGPGALTTG